MNARSILGFEFPIPFHLPKSGGSGSLGRKCGCSSGVERNLAKVEVGRSNRLTRSIIFKGLREIVTPFYLGAILVDWPCGERCWRHRALNRPIESGFEFSPSMGSTVQACKRSKVPFR